MSRISLLRALAACACALTLATPALAQPPQAEDGVFPYPVHRTSLENGLDVIVVPMPSDGLVSYWSIVRTGSRDEVEEGVTGFAHFFEHMMFHGSERFPGDVYDEIVASMGASANAYTTDDYTAYHLSFVAEDLPRVVEIEADRFQNLTYEEDEFKTEAGAVFGEYRKGRTSPWQVLFEAVQEAAFDEHTYRHTTIGFVEDIQAMPTKYDYSKSFFDRFYRPENVVLLVTGDVEPDRVVELVRENYAGWEPGYAAPAIPTEPEQTAPRRITVPFEGQTLPVVSIHYKGPALDASDPVMVAGLLIGELAFGQTSPLYKKLVLEEQRLEALFEMFTPNRDPGLWSVFAMVKDLADVHAVEAELVDTVAGLREELVDPARLEDTRKRMKYAFLSGLSTPSEVAGDLASYVALTGGVEVVDELYTTLATVTPEHVREAARRWLTPERSTTSFLHSQGTTPPPPPQPTAAADAPTLSEPPVLLPVPSDPTVAYSAWVQVGSEDDPPGEEGLAYLTAQMVADAGTQRNTYERILAELYPLAASYGASVDREMTVVRGRVHRDEIDAFSELFVDAIVRPGFRDDDFERIKSSAISGIENSLRYSSDEELGKAALYTTVFAGTPYGHIEAGTVQSLRAITLEDVRAFHAEHYTRDNVVLGLGGAYPPELPERLARELGALPAGTPERTPAPEPAPIAGRHVVIVEKPGDSAAISFGHPIDVRRGSREFYALWVANSWLGEHRNSTSHLYQVIREERGMNYGDYSYIEAFPGGGRRTMPPTGVGRRQQLFEVWIRPVPREQTLFALRAALREVALLAENGLTQEQFEATRAFLRKYSLHFAETTAERLGYAVDDRFYGLDDHLAAFRAAMEDLTLEEVNAAVRAHLQTDDLVIAIVASDAEELESALVAGEPSPITYPEGVTKSPETLAEDRIIQAWPLRIPAENVTIRPVDTMFEAPDAASAGVREASAPGR